MQANQEGQTPVVPVQNQAPAEVFLNPDGKFSEADRRVAVLAVAKLLETEPGGKVSLLVEKRNRLSAKMDTMLIGGKSVNTIEITEVSFSKSPTGADTTSNFKHYFHVDGNPTWARGKYITTDGSLFTLGKNNTATAQSFDDLPEADKQSHIKFSVQVLVAGLVGVGKLEIVRPKVEQSKPQ